jgi:hypothetical protein
VSLSRGKYTKANAAITARENVRTVISIRVMFLFTDLSHSSIKILITAILIAPLFQKGCAATGLSGNGSLKPASERAIC